MGRKLLTITLLVAVLCSSGYGQSSLQTALNGLGYSIDVGTDVIAGEVFFQRTSSNAEIVYQSSSQYLIEAMGWYSASSTTQWLIGGTRTGLPRSATLPLISGAFGFSFHPNFTGEGFIQGVWYSEVRLNVDNADHLRVFPTEIGGVVVPNSFILAWEDLSGLGDADYEDFVVRVNGVTTALVPPAPPPLNLPSLQAALDRLGYSINVAQDAIPGEVFFQRMHTDASIIYQSSSQYLIEAMGWYSSISEPHWVIGGSETGLPNIAQLPTITGSFGFSFHPNFTGAGFIRGIWYSEERINSDSKDHLIVFPTEIGGTIIPYSYVLAWEDLENLGDADYEDFVARVTGVEAVPPPPPPSFFSVTGTVSTTTGTNIPGVTISFTDNAGALIGSVLTNNSGGYAFSLSTSFNEVSVDLQIPLGYAPSTPPSVLVPGSGTQSVSFVLTTQSTGKVVDYWWWKRQIEDIRNGVSTGYGSMTRNEFNTLGQRIFEHFYLKDGGYAIMIEGLTYAGVSARAMSFDDIYNTFFALDKETNPGKTKAHLLAVLLNVASGRLSQLAKVSKDNANVSQAITYYTGLHSNGWNDWTYWYHIMKIHCPSFGIIPSGVIPLATPVILYKVEDHAGELPQSPMLSQNYPNPFNPTTELSFTIPARGHATVEVFNSLGQRLAILVDRELEPGDHRVTFDGGRYSSGVYYYRLTANDQTTSKKMMLIK